MLGELVRRKRLDFSLLQDELGVRVGYSPTSAKQAISQIERGAVMVPARKLSPLVSELMLDEQLFRQIAFYLDINNYEEAARRLDQYFQEQFGYSMVEEKTVSQSKTAKDSNPKPTAPSNRSSANASRHARHGNPPQPADDSMTKAELRQKLEDLKELLEAELISQSDYDNAKADLLKQWL
ncbi:MAG: helix-turn-helix domain-containing protein [Bacteroidota bacterium]